MTEEKQIILEDESEFLGIHIDHLIHFPRRSLIKLYRRLDSNRDIQRPNISRSVFIPLVASVQLIVFPSDEEKSPFVPMEQCTSIHKSLTGRPKWFLFALFQALSSIGAIEVGDA